MRVKSLLLGSALAAGLIAGLSAPAGAALSFYSNSAAFSAAAPGLPTETFAGLAADLGVGPDGGVAINNGADSTVYAGMVAGAAYAATTNVGGDLAVLGPNFGGAGLSEYSLWGNHGGGITISFGPSVDAVSLDLFGQHAGSTLDITVLGADGALGSTSVIGATSGAGEFLGVTSSTPITGIEVRLVTDVGDNSMGVANVSFGAPAPVPEPATWAMLFLGLAGVGAALRRGRAAMALA